MERKDFRNALLENQSGFTLIEILIALTLLALAGTFVAGKFFDNLSEGKVSSAKIQMNSLDGRLKEFRRKCNTYPTTDQGLEALITKPSGGRECKDYPPNGFIEDSKVPQDPWDTDFVYESDGKSFNIYSLGADKEIGGAGFDADIYLRPGAKSAAAAGSAAGTKDEPNAETQPPAEGGQGNNEAPPQ